MHPLHRTQSLGAARVLAWGWRSLRMVVASMWLVLTAQTCALLIHGHVYFVPENQKNHKDEYVTRFLLYVSVL